MDAVRGTTDQIAEAVQRVKDTLYHNSGVIAQCEFGPGARPENIEMVYQAWNEVI
jgi:uroporphyrinogen decarboxylase